MHPDEIMRWRDAVFITQQMIIEKCTAGYVEILDLDSPLYRPGAERPPEPGECLLLLGVKPY
jgi:hypothetical protein